MSIITPNNYILNNSPSFYSHTRTSSTSPKKIQLKDQIIQQISTIMSLELNKIDVREIETKLSIYFNISENDESNSYVKTLCNNITETKNSTINKVKNFLNHNINTLAENNLERSCNLSESNLSYINEDYDSLKNKFKLISKEIKILNNNSRVKFKKLYDSLSNEFDKMLSSTYDYLQKGNSKLILDRLNRIEQIKNDILFDVTSVENLQNKFIDNLKNIINKEHLNQKEKINLNESKQTNYSLGRNRAGKHCNKKKNNLENSSLLNLNNYLSPNENDIYNKTFNSRCDTNIYYTNNDENECIKLYRVKIKEKKNEIEKLKKLLQEEKESKNKAINELNKLQFSHKMSLSLTKTQKNYSNIEKFNKLTEMIIGFTYSMNNLRNSLYQKTVSHMDAKNIYGQLKMKLMSLCEEANTLKNDLTNSNNNDNEKDKNNFIKNDYDEDINGYDNRTIKEENENSQILSERDINNNNLNNQLNNVANNNITLNTLPNYNIEEILEENKKLRIQLAEKMVNYCENLNNNIGSNINSNTNIENNNKEIINNSYNIDIFKKQINELKKIILEKEQEIEDLKNKSLNNQKDELNNVIQNNAKNLEQLKTIYQLLIDGKDNRIKELEDDIISYEKEIELLKEENNNLKKECRKDKILSEAEVNNLKNQKIELQCLLEQGAINSSAILNTTSLTYNDNIDKEKVINLENEIKLKNKQILLLTQNHENDLKELNLAIEMLKQKISELEEENLNLSERKKKEDNNNK